MFKKESLVSLALANYFVLWKCQPPCDMAHLISCSSLTLVDCCSMPYAVCRVCSMPSMQYAEYAVCSMQYAEYAVCSMQHTMGN